MRSPSLRSSSFLLLLSALWLASGFIGRSSRRSVVRSLRARLGFGRSSLRSAAPAASLSSCRSSLRSAAPAPSYLGRYAAPLFFLLPPFARRRRLRRRRFLSVRVRCAPAAFNGRLLLSGGRWLRPPASGFLPRPPPPGGGGRLYSVRVRCAPAAFFCARLRRFRPLRSYLPPLPSAPFSGAAMLRKLNFETITHEFD